jgi:hypothetical protein
MFYFDQLNTSRERALWGEQVAFDLYDAFFG